MNTHGYPQHMSNRQVCTDQAREHEGFVDRTWAEVAAHYKEQERMETLTPGIYENVPFETYLKWKAVNNSSLAPAQRSMLHYFTGKQKESSPALTFGSLCHTGRLELSALLRRYVVMPDLTQGICKADGTPAQSPKATNEYRKREEQFVKQHSDKQIVSQDQFDRMVGVVTAIDYNAKSHAAFSAPGPTEVSILWVEPETGLLCKIRVDKLTLEQRTITDLKTTQDCTQFSYSIDRYGYDRQAAFYIDGVKQATGIECQFVIVAVESEKPHGVMTAPMGPDSVERGRDTYKRLLRQIKYAKETGQWGGYESPEEWNVPPYKLNKESCELIINGEVVEA